MMIENPVKLLLIILMFNQITVRECVDFENYFQLFCSFLKFNYQCRDALKGRKHGLLPYSFQLNLKEDCGFNDNIIENVFFKSSGDNIFTYSVFKFKLQQSPTSRSFNLTKRTFYVSPSIPMSELIVALNNKNIPLIFLYLPINSAGNVLSNRTKNALSQLQIKLHFGRFEDTMEIAEKVDFDTLNFTSKNSLYQYCKPLAGLTGARMLFSNLSIESDELSTKRSSISKQTTVSSMGNSSFAHLSSAHNFSSQSSDELTKNFSSIKNVDFNDSTSDFLNSGHLTSANLESKHSQSILLESVSNDDRKSSKLLYSEVVVEHTLNFMHDNFNGYIRLPAAIENELRNDNFLYYLNRDSKGLAIELKLIFENMHPDLGDLLSDESIRSLEGSIVMHNCAKFNRSSFFTIYDCHVSTEFGSLDCDCQNQNMAIFFNYTQFVSIYCLILFLVFFLRLSRVALDYINRILLFERTKSDRTLYVLCSNKNALFDYVLTFEIGCPTAAFDLETTCIDFELQGPDNRTMTQGRILCKILGKEQINRISFKIKRLVQLNPEMLDSITIQHNGANPDAKIFLYDIILNQVSEQKKSIFSINDYIRSYKQKYILTVNLAAKSSKIEPVDSDKYDFKQGTNSQNSPVSIKDCELFPGRRLRYQNYPDPNEFEIELLLILSCLFSFLILRLIVASHRLCKRRTLGCYFNHFRTCFILTFFFYLITYLLYKFVFKNQQMKAIYFKRKSSVWSLSACLLQFALALTSIFVAFIIYTSTIPLYEFDFYTCSLVILYVFPLFILLVDLLNILIKNLTFVQSLRSIKAISNSKLKVLKKSSTSLKTNMPVIKSASNDNFAGVERFKSSEFKPHISQPSLRELKSNELDEACSDLFSKFPSRKSGSVISALSSTKSLKEPKKIKKRSP